MKNIFTKKSLLCITAASIIMVLPWSQCSYWSDGPSNHYKVYGSYLMWEFGVIAGPAVFLLSLISILLLIKYNEASFVLKLALIVNTYILFSKMHRPITILSIIIEALLGMAVFMEYKAKHN